MAKNKALMNGCKILYKKIQSITPEIYASFALVLSRNYGWTHEQIEELFMQSQELWNECANSSLNMVEICDEETGIELRSM